MTALTFTKVNSKYGFKSDHGYTLVDCTEDKVKLYNPHGKYLTVPMNILIENLVSERFVHGRHNMPSVRTVKEFYDSWNEVDNGKQSSFVDYNLTVEEHDTVILFNVIRNEYNDVIRHICVTPADDEANSVKTACLSLRAVLQPGNYKIKLQQCMYKRDKGNPNKYSSCSKKDKNSFCFRFAASKQCFVEKSVGRGKMIYNI